MKYTLYSAPWCSSCAPIKKFVETNKMAAVTVIDIDQNFEAAKAAGVRGIPTLRLEDGTLKTDAKSILEILKEELTTCQ